MRLRLSTLKSSEGTPPKCLTVAKPSCVVDAEGVESVVGRWRIGFPTSPEGRRFPCQPLWGPAVPAPMVDSHAGRRVVRNGGGVITARPRVMPPSASPRITFPRTIVPSTELPLRCACPSGVADDVFVDPPRHSVTLFLLTVFTMNPSPRSRTGRPSVFWL